MTDTIKKADFIELNYTGKLPDGTIFDTTVEKVAKDSGFYNEKTKFSPVKICVGEQQLLIGLEEGLVDKEIGKEYVLSLTPENAFGKRDIKKMKIMPISAFKDHDMMPQVGLQINVDGEIGQITRFSGGRVIVNFNHPLAGKEVVYEVKVIRKISDKKEKLSAYLNNVLRIPEDKLKFELKEDHKNAEIELPFDLPPQFLQALEEKIASLIGFTEVKFIKKKSAEKKGTEKNNLETKETETAHHHSA